jgi:hypothetical protein
MPIARPALFLLGLACSSLLPAAGPMVVGLHLNLAMAQGDFREEMGSKIGLGTGLSLTVPLTTTLSFRPNLSFQTFPTLHSQYAYKSTRYSDRGNEDAHWSAWAYGADCLYRPSGPQGKLYLLGGAYLKVWKLHGFGTYTTQDALNATRTYGVDDTTSKNEPAVTMGLGCTLSRHLSLETRTVFASYRSLSYNTLELSLVLSY